MLKDITLGQYYSTDSFVHRLDPRTKTFSFVLFVVCVLLSNNIVCYIVTLLLLAFAVILSHVPLKYMFRGFKPIVTIVLLTDIISILLLDNGLEKSAVITIKLAQIVISSNLLTLTTKPKDISDGIEKSFGPVKMHTFATMVLIALRFIPILTNEANVIMDAQKSRGADFENGSLVKRAKALVCIIVPMFECAFRKSDELAMAMDSRLYGMGKPSRLHPLKYSAKDYIVKAVYLCLLTAICFWRFYVGI